MPGIINWEELRRLSMPPGMPKPPDKGGPNTTDTDEFANMYNRMAKMEKSYTPNQLNTFDTSNEDTVLDIGCGPGRIAVQMAQRVKSVTALDISSKCLRHCENNAREAGVTNLTTRLMNWQDAVLGENLEQHDIVISSRSVGINEIEKISTFARKYVVVIAWANAPNIPYMLSDLFAGVENAKQYPKMRLDRSIGYNVTYNTIYDMGFDPNIRIVKDGFTRDFTSRDEAYQELWLLQESAERPIPDIFKQNADTWLTPNADGGVTFRRETKTFVIWFSPEKAAEPDTAS